MRLLTGADIIDFHNSRGELLVITASGEFTTINYSDTGDQADAYATVTTDEGEVQVLLERSTLNDGDWFPGALDEHDDLIPSAADEMAAIINGDAGLHTRIQVNEVREATAAWEASAQETNRLADERARRVADFVKHCGGNQSQAARMLGLDQSTVNKLVRKVAA